MKSARFREAATALADRACIMCAETNPDDCHRLHIADWLARRGHALNPQEELWRED